MNSTVLSLLAAFLLSLMGLFAFMWSMRKGLLVENPGAASAIFTPGEIGQADDPTLTAHDRERLQKAINATHAKTPDERWHNEPDTDFTREQRMLADESSRWPVLLLLVFAVLWLVLGSLAGLTASLKLHMPDWLVAEAWQTFGRMRTMHLTAVFYGWITNAALAAFLAGLR